MLRDGSSGEKERERGRKRVKREQSREQWSNRKRTESLSNGWEKLWKWS